MSEKKCRCLSFLFTILFHLGCLLIVGNCYFLSDLESSGKEQVVEVEIFGTGSLPDEEVGGGGGGGDRLALESGGDAGFSESQLIPTQEVSKQVAPLISDGDRSSETKRGTLRSESQGSGNVVGGASGNGSGGGIGPGSGGGIGGGHGTGEGSGSGPGRGGGIAPPQVLSKVEPRYPDSAIQAGLSGTVTVSVGITMDGSVSNVSIISSSGHSELDQAVLSAVRKWRFAPAKNLGNGKAVASRVTLPVVFNLKNR